MRFLVTMINEHHRTKTFTVKIIRTKDNTFSFIEKQKNKKLKNKLHV